MMKGDGREGSMGVVRGKEGWGKSACVEPMQRREGARGKTVD